jgi:hypothetical protein
LLCSSNATSTDDLSLLSAVAAAIVRTVHRMDRR